ncbi:tRNA(Ile)-lysidine synthase [Lachnospiraceae bacterium NE2001]|nr:tRNA(Ile)-lysidine synthase [Lachnospiraceae bacterium NE2001]
MGLYESVTEYMRENNMLTGIGSVVVGVSGGADSVALLRVLCQLRDEMAQKDKMAQKKGLDLDDSLYIRVIHINHMIRGAEADRDEQFVADLCKKLKVSCKVYRENIPKLAKEKHMSEEEAGRMFRYQCFEMEANEISSTEAVQIAVAHNKDDLAETVLFNLVRGSSLLGLAGIKPVNGRIIRPLLMNSRAEIEEYLDALDQDYITDSTNLSTDYTRNKLRLGIIPQLKEINDGAVSHIVDIARDAYTLSEDIYAEIFRNYMKPLSEPDVEKKYHPEMRQELDISKLQNLSTLARGELVLMSIKIICGKRKDITREHVNQILSLADMESGKRVDLPYDMQAYRSYDKIVIIKKGAEPDAENLIIKPEGLIETEVFLYDESLDLSKKEYTKLIDCDKINFVPVLRIPKPDDFIVVSSDGGTKKLSRFFTHSKIDREQRAVFPVVADGNEIIWVVGLRLSERYKVTGSTKRVMKITYTNK